MPIAARVVGDVDMRAVLAAHDMPAENRRAAALDRAHHLHLAKAHVAGIGATPSRSVVAEDVRDLQNWTGHDRRGYAGGSSLGSSFLDLNGARRSNGLMTARKPTNCATNS